MNSRVRAVAGVPRHLAGWRPARPRLNDVVLPDPGIAAGDRVLLDWGVPVFDQGQVGDCVFNARAALMAWLELKAGRPGVTFSRYFGYAMDRIREGVPLSEDSGADPTSAMISLADVGCCLESEWPSTDPAGWQHAPSVGARMAAAKHAGGYFYGAGSLEAMFQSIVDGHPVSFGFTVYPSFESNEVAATGDVPMPGPGEQANGGHCMVAIGFDRGADMVDYVNSWGEDWGAGGRGRMPCDFWRRGIATDNKTLRRFPL